MKILLACLLSLVSFHPLHVTVTEIEFDEKEKRLEIMMRVFADDLETTMRKQFNQPELDIIRPKGTTVDQMMTEYLKNHLKISLEGKPQKVTYLGHEIEGEAFIFYIEVSNVKKLKTISVSNDILMEIHNDQSNLVHVTVRGTVRSLRLTTEKASDKLTFDSK
ncbi:MAG: DUF6702 family protein [Chryseolinea sp.]